MIPPPERLRGRQRCRCSIDLHIANGSRTEWADCNVVVFPDDPSHSSVYASRPFFDHALSGVYGAQIGARVNPRLIDDEQLSTVGWKRAASGQLIESHDGPAVG